MVAAALRTLFVVAPAFAVFLGVHAAEPVLTVDGGRFRVDGQARFLVFVSYFDALDATSATLRSDFGTLKGKGVDGVRIMPNWWGKTSTESTNSYSAHTVISPAGAATNLAALSNVLQIAADAGLVVDLSFTSETLHACARPPCTALQKPASPLIRRQLGDALASIARDLASRGTGDRHVLFDIQNEGNLWPAADGPLDAAAVSGIVTAIHAADPKRIVTMSLDQNRSAAATALFAESAKLDVIAWHEERIPSWWTFTGARIAEMRAKSGKPIYLQEPEPAHNSTRWTLAGIKANLQAAKGSGAAAWCFHTHAGYYLDDGSSCFTHLNADEAAFINALSGVR